MSLWTKGVCRDNLTRRQVVKQWLRKKQTQTKRFSVLKLLYCDEPTWRSVQQWWSVEICKCKKQTNCVYDGVVRSTARWWEGMVSSHALPTDLQWWNWRSRARAITRTHGNSKLKKDLNVPQKLEGRTHTSSPPIKKLTNDVSHWFVSDHFEALGSAFWTVPSCSSCNTVSPCIYRDFSVVFSVLRSCFFDSLLWLALQGHRAEEHINALNVWT